jgi:hypothetical protein
LASSVPNLCLDDLIIDPNASGGELNPNGGLGFEAELVPGEPGQQVGFANPRVADQHHLEQVIVIVVCSIRAHFLAQFLQWVFKSLVFFSFFCKKFQSGCCWVNGF